MDAHEFGAFVAECRKDKKMTQADLAAKIQVTNEEATEIISDTLKVAKLQRKQERKSVISKE